MKRKIINLRTIMAVILAGTFLFTSVKTGLSGIDVNAEPESQTEYKVSAPRVEKSPGKQKVTYDIIEFGSYPQSEVTGEALTEEITEAEYDEYGDCTVGQNKYRRMEIKENEGGNDTDANVINENEEGDDTKTSETNEKYRYFKYEPLLWRVLDVYDNQITLLSDKAIDAQWYDNEQTLWSNSKLRKWINGLELFESDYKYLKYPKLSMIETMFSNDEMSELYIYGLKNDRISLITEYETRNEDYGFIKYDKIDDRARQMCATDYAIANESKVELHEDGKYYAEWWTESVGANWVCDVSVVLHSGYVNVSGTYMNGLNLKGLRPAICPMVLLKQDSQYYKVIGTRTIETEYEEPLETTAPPATATPIETTAPPKTIPPVNTTNPPMPEKEAGDIDGNGKVDLSDAKQGLEIALGIRNITNDKIKFGDMDSDGKITLKDVVLILKKALGIQDN